ncbi:amidase [Bradyrhizobium prioriisuperbiae]|uniref:amidase n=1 Tax=Bradyrhizobium prioriisuperbiae TaxID=2854389 RepID=UPI0028E61C65|nr:amidase [Bradyrhizobium prioritasuperba]
MTDRDLLFMPATTAADLIRKRALSPVEYVDAVLGAIERTQPTLNAFSVVTAEDARNKARAAEQAVMAGKELGPLHGIPMNIKDLFVTKGVRTSFGSAVYADNIPTTDDDVLVTRLNAAGGIMVGKSTTPEFGHKGHTDGPSFGITRNPWNTERTAGGSSGGAAAAAAAGLGPLGLGTDGAGSIRIPASACGVVGLKPTTGLVPYEQAPDIFYNYAAAGPLTRTVADCALMMDALVGPSVLDPWSLKAPAVLPPSTITENLSGIRIGYLPALTACSPDVTANTQASLAVLASLGAEVDEVGAGMEWNAQSARLIYLTNLHVNFSGYVEKWRSRMDPVLLQWMEAGSRTTVDDYRKAQIARTQLYRGVQKLLERYDFLVSPTLPTTAIPAEAGRTVDALFNRGWNAFVYPFNHTGNPALSVPSGFGADGLPTGLQIVGRWWGDNDVMGLGAVFEQARPWADRHPPV